MGSLREKPSKYFLNLEKLRCKEKTITHPITESGEVLEDPKDILSEERNFYQNLYSQQPVSEIPNIREHRPGSLNHPQDIGLG